MRPRSPYAARTGEGSRRIAEELAFDQCIRNGGAVDGDERLSRTAAGQMQRPGEHLLARAGRTQDEHRDRAVGDTPCIAQIPQHLRVLARELLQAETRDSVFRPDVHHGVGMACNGRCRARPGRAHEAREVPAAVLVVAQLPHRAASGRRGGEQLVVARVEDSLIERPTSSLRVDAPRSFMPVASLATIVPSDATAIAPSCSRSTNSGR